VLKVDAAAVDCGSGSHFDKVLSFTRPRLSRKVLAIKGVAGMGRPALTATKSRAGHRRLFICGVDGIKSAITDGERKIGRRRYEGVRKAAEKVKGAAKAPPPPPAPRVRFEADLASAIARSQRREVAPEFACLARRAPSLCAYRMVKQSCKGGQQCWSGGSRNR